MKLDYELVRTLLIYVEENINFGGFKDTKSIAEDLELPERDITYTAVKLQEAGFLHLNVKEWNTPVQASHQCVIYSLTFSGHEYLNSIRNEKVWQKIKSAIAKNGEIFTFQVITSVSKVLIEKLLTSALNG